MAWQEQENIKARLDLPILSDLPIENLLGAKDKIGKNELSMQEESIHKLMSYDFNLFVIRRKTLH